MSRVGAVVMLGCAVLLAACGNYGDTSRDGPPRTAVHGSTSPSRPQVESRAFGEYVGFGPNCQSRNDPACNIRLTVIKLTDCAPGASFDRPPPPGTHRKVVWMDVATGPDFSNPIQVQESVTGFTAVDARGVTSGSIRGDYDGPCLPTHQRLGVPTVAWQPNKKYSGGVEVFLPDGTVKIVNGSNSVEWTLP
ncbi:hypothetical protein [Actinocrispum wychmicini]|uniref:Uncharacterized protein n=1 Tax=Actinocrispum wychmicini TaxID=1213861 RepID=A0A4R2IQ67_9PSEU|nr:hypothetical protein [Actinocrispum wychmicini]TCO47294.1 hypothetical protein EV192_11734 [Actinocrispum wychmicini]